MEIICSVLGLLCPQVDAFYYADRNSLAVHELYEDVGTIENCRAVVQAAAARKGDPQLRRGDYECGIGPTGDGLGDIRVYEKTVR